VASGTMQRPFTADVDLLYDRITIGYVTSGTEVLVKTYSKNIVGVMTGTKGGTGSYDSGGILYAAGNKLYYVPKVTQNSFTINYVVAFERT